MATKNPQDTGQPLDDHDYTVAGRAIGRWIARSCAESPPFRAKVREIVDRAREEKEYINERSNESRK